MASTSASDGGAGADGYLSSMELFIFLWFELCSWGGLCIRIDQQRPSLQTFAKYVLFVAVFQHDEEEYSKLAEKIRKSN